MKPILIPCSPDRDGRVHITMKELSDMLEKAYNAGKSDGTHIHYDCPNKWYWTNDYGLNKPYITWTSNGTSTNSTLTSTTGNTTSNVTINS